MLINAHPSKLLLNTVGGVIALYFLWEHKFISAVLLGGFFILLGTIISTKFSRINPEKLATKLSGKIFLRYSTVFGFSCYLISHILIPVSAWMHNFYLTGLGLFFLVSGLFYTGESATTNT